MQSPQEPVQHHTGEQIVDVPVPQILEAQLRERGQLMRSRVKVVRNGHHEQTLDKLHADLYTDLDIDGDGKASREIFDDTGGPDSLRGKFVIAFKGADKYGAGLLDEEEEETPMKIVDEMEGTEFHSSVVSLRERDPGFVDALDTDTAPAQHRSTQQRKQWQQEGERSKQVEKDVMEWTAVTRNKRQQKKMIQIFVKVGGCKARWR